MSGQLYAPADLPLGKTPAPKTGGWVGPTAGLDAVEKEQSNVFSDGETGRRKGEELSGRMGCAKFWFFY